MLWNKHEFAHEVVFTCPFLCSSYGALVCATGDILPASIPPAPFTFALPDAWSFNLAIGALWWPKVSRGMRMRLCLDPVLRCPSVCVCVPCLFLVCPVLLRWPRGAGCELAHVPLPLLLAFARASVLSCSSVVCVCVLCSFLVCPVLLRWPGGRVRG